MRDKYKLSDFSTKRLIISSIIVVLTALTGIILINAGTLNIVNMTWGADVMHQPSRLVAMGLMTALENFFGYSTFIHPNWWKVLLILIGFLLVTYLILTLLLSYYDLHDDLDYPEGKRVILPVVWLMFYFSLAGLGLGFFPSTEYGAIHSYILLFGIIYLLASCLIFSPDKIFPSIILFILLIIIAAILYAYCVFIAWIALMLLIYWFCKNIRNISFSPSQAKAYNDEADELNQERDFLRNNSDSISKEEIDDLNRRISNHNQKI